MFGATEIFGIPVVLILLWLWWAFSKSQEEKSNSVGYTQTITWKTTPVLFVRLFLPNAITNQLGFHPCEHNNGAEVYQRGRTNIATPGSVVWQSMPTTLTVTYSGDVDHAEAVFLFEAPKAMEFTKEEAASFHRNAENDIDLLLAYLNRPKNHSAADEENEENDYFDDEDEDDDEVEENDHDEDYSADLERLGLQPDATWDQVKTAYRQLCLKYHPDTLASQKLPEHIVELAVERFRAVGDSYRRLCEYYGE